MLSKDLVVYCGHGAGERFIRRETVEKLPLGKCGVALLIGCSSGHLSVHGTFEPVGMSAAYLSAGCPAVVANLWDVTDRDIDRVTEHLLSGWAGLPTPANYGEAEEGTSSAAAGSGRRGADEGGVSLLESLANSRAACKLQNLIGCAPVCYGVPVQSANRA